MHFLIIYGGSAGKNGNSWKIIEHLKLMIDAEVIDITDYKISFYDYLHRNQDDDFKLIAEKMVEASCIVFVSVYWYAMSAELKLFFDRLTDLLDLWKPIGKKLAGKQTALLAIGGNLEIPEGFTVPFSGTANYFNMEYLGHHYITTKKNFFDESKIVDYLESFVLKLKTLTKKNL